MVSRDVSPKFNFGSGPFLLIAKIVIAMAMSFFPVLHLVTVILDMRKKPQSLRQHSVHKGMSILIPCYNEQKILETAIQGLGVIDYRKYETIFINDGSTDSTMIVLNRLLALAEEDRLVHHDLHYGAVKGFYKSSIYPNVYVLDKENGGKADALNAGIAYASLPYVVTLDADSILEKNALRYANEYLQDETVIALGGTVTVLQGWSRSSRDGYNYSLRRIKWIVKFQVLEYMKGFFVLKDSLAHRNALIVISGAFGVFSRKVICELGGFRKTLGEDIDVTIKFQNYIRENPHLKMLYAKEAICYTECPETWRDLQKQRIRWQKAFIDCLLKYGPSMLKRIYNPLSIFFIVDSFLVGVIATTLVLAQIAFLAVASPLGLLWYLEFYFIGSSAVTLLWSLYSVIMSTKLGARYRKSDVLRFGCLMLLDVCVYRLISTYLVVVGTVAYFFFRGHAWNKVQRTGRNYDIAG